VGCAEIKFSPNKFFAKVVGFFPSSVKSLILSPNFEGSSPTAATRMVLGYLFFKVWEIWFGTFFVRSPERYASNPIA
jgi:hypothetical protein